MPVDAEEVWIELDPEGDSFVTADGHITFGRKIGDAWEGEAERRRWSLKAILRPARSAGSSGTGRRGPGRRDTDEGRGKNEEIRAGDRHGSDGIAEG